MSPTTEPADDFSPVTDPLAMGPARTPGYRTGLTALDTVTGGISLRDLWLLTGAPGQGRSMLLTQLAAHLALEHHLQTYLVSNRDSAAVVVARVHANAARVPLGHIIENRLTTNDEERLVRSTQQLLGAPLHVAAGPYARHRTVDPLQRLARTEPIVAAFDDTDWETDWDLKEARHLADSGAAVIVALPRERVLHQSASGTELNPAIGLADLVLEVRHDRTTESGQLVAVTEPGQAVLTVLRNRRGPRHAFSVGFFAHMARYFDVEP